MDKVLILDAIKVSFQKLNPKNQIHNPVMFITYLGAILCTLRLIYAPTSAFEVLICASLWPTVLFANFSEALAEGRGKAQAASLRKNKKNVMAKLYNQETKTHQLIPAEQLKKGDIVLCEPNDLIPSDGDVIEGIASVDESAITGESAPVIRENGGDRSAVTGGTTVKSDRIIVQITVDQGASFVDRMIGLIEGAARQKTPNEIALSLVLSGLSLILLVVVVTLKVYATLVANEAGQNLDNIISVPVLVALLVCLIPTTIGGLLTTIGISGMNRLMKRNVMAKSGRAVEAAGDISVLLLDKTGTITFGNRMADDFIPAPGIDYQELLQGCYLSSISDLTPEGKSIVTLSEKWARERNLSIHQTSVDEVDFVPFTAQTRMSGVDYKDKKISIRKGAIDAVTKFVTNIGGVVPEQLILETQKIARSGGTPLLVCNNEKSLGVIHLKDIIKPGIRERFRELRQMGIKTIMITGDNPLTAASIAAEAGVDDFMAEATPEAKLDRIKKEQQKGYLVAMTGDGTNDAPALAQADVGVAMNIGTQAAREAGNMVDLDSDPTKLIDVVCTGKELLITRGALTTFSFANDAAKYFAILPAIFSTLYASKTSEFIGPLASWNVMNLHSPQSAILSAVIFNAIIIILLAPLALKGVQSKAASANVLLYKNVLIFGVGGVIFPFIGIKIIDLLIYRLV